MNGAASMRPNARQITTLSILILVLTGAGLIARTASARRDAAAKGSLALHSVRGSREILRASRQFFAEGGWTIEPSTADGLTFSYDLRPSRPLLVLLLVFGVIPGLIYLAMSGKSLSVNVKSTRAGSGSATRVSWSNSLACEHACRDFARMIRDQEPDRGGLRPHRSVPRRGYNRRTAAKHEELPPDPA
jgi:hypothetical protein